jgi:predicted Holliday junction resolvase-like endonuclease
MKKKLKEIVENIEYEDLLKLKRDIEENQGTHVKEILNKKIEEIEEKEKSMCVICGRTINPYAMDHYTLIFGPRDMRKKANFCAVDCLQYFLKQLKPTKIVEE